ncbi:MAG: lipoprotein [Ignavibacteriae bacterium]|nr:lipoprotein [Ignavibacteriota bacterium]
MKKLLLLTLFVALLAGCSKMEDKKNTSENKTMAPVKPGTENPHQNMSQTEQGDMTKSDKTDMAGEDAQDKKAEEFSKVAYDFENNYAKDNSLKKDLIAKHMAAGNYLMFEANLSPKKKYKPALKHYRRVLELDPSNAEAMRNKTQIEEIYTGMGREIPKD